MSNGATEAFGAGGSPQVPGGGPQAVTGESAALKQRLMQALGQMMQQRRALPQQAPVVSPGELQRQPMQQLDTRRLTGMTKKDVGRERAGNFIRNLGASVQNAVAAHKEKQVRLAMSDWMNLQQAFERAEMMGKPLDQDPIAAAILGDPKKMKNMAKAFAAPWLDPGKQTVYGEALKRAMESDKAGKLAKAMRALHLMTQRQVQMSQQERQQFAQGMGQAVSGMAGPARPDLAGLEKVTRIQAEMARTRAEEERVRPSYETRETDAGLIAINPKDPRDVVPITLKGGEQAVGATGATEVVRHGVEGPPFGVKTKQGIVVPGDPRWNDKYQKIVDADRKSWEVAEKEKFDRQQRAESASFARQLRAQEFALSQTERKELQTFRKDYVLPVNTYKTNLAQAESILARVEERLRSGVPEKDALTGPESMVLASRHMMQTVGAIRGSRMGQYLFREHIGARPLVESLFALEQEVAGQGGRITVNQARQFVQLARDITRISQETAEAEAKLRGYDPTAVFAPSAAPKIDEGPPVK